MLDQGMWICLIGPGSSGYDSIWFYLFPYLLAWTWRMSVIALCGKVWLSWAFLFIVIFIPCPSAWIDPYFVILDRAPAPVWGGNSWVMELPTQHVLSRFLTMPSVFLAVLRKCPHSMTAIEKWGFAASSMEILPTSVFTAAFLWLLAPSWKVKRQRTEKGLGEQPLPCLISLDLDCKWEEQVAPGWTS